MWVKLILQAVTKDSKETVASGEWGKVVSYVANARGRSRGSMRCSECRENILSLCWGRYQTFHSSSCRDVMWDIGQ